MAKRLSELSFLNKGIKLVLTDKREGSQKEEIYYHENGIEEYVAYLNRNKDVIHKKIIFFENVKEDVMVDVAMQYTNKYAENLYSYTNNIHTHEGGTHESGFKTALTRTINDYARRQKFLKENEENLTGDDIREGLTAVISVKVPEPQFEGQTKTKLGRKSQDRCPC